MYTTVIGDCGYPALLHEENPEDTEVGERPLQEAIGSRPQRRGTPERGQAMSDEVQSFTNVWDGIADTPEEAANLRARADLILAVEGRLTEFGWSQTTAARNLGITQPRVSDLICGKISKFSLDTLVNLAARVGLRTQLVITADLAD
jgi:predicted XRE-type DNA-binding protein